jgi:beta-barrel assembly-enhancing protease
VTLRAATSLLLVGLVMAACATPRATGGTTLGDTRHARPALDTDEAGLWMAMDRAETSLRRSGLLMTDEALNSYLRGIVCKLAPAHCHDLRVYVVRTPQFNATMAPNGVMQVWTGLLLRADNEAQLAYVLGHEIGHYLERHSLQRWRDARLKGDLLAFFSLGAAASGVGFVTPLVHLATLASVYAFSRDNEREADEIGFALMKSAGYDPREAPGIWESLQKERDASNSKQPLLFFATHPSAEERVGTLRELARKAYAPEQLWTVGRDELLAATLPHRAVLLRDELRQRDFKRTAVLLDRLLAQGVGTGELQYFKAEMYRLRNEDGDAAQAVVAYEAAIASATAPVDAHRALGLVLMKQGEKAKARAAFTEYLARHPEADDRAMVELQLRQLE